MKQQDLDLKIYMAAGPWVTVPLPVTAPPNLPTQLSLWALPPDPNQDPDPWVAVQDEKYLSTRTCSLCSRTTDESYCVQCCERVEGGPNPHSMTRNERVREMEWLLDCSWGIPSDVLERRIRVLTGQPLYQHGSSASYQSLIESARQNGRPDVQLKLFR